MIRILSKILIMVSVLGFVPVLYAASPKYCPSSSAIIAQGVTQPYSLLFNFYITTQYGVYDTDSPWFFGLGIIDADDGRDALKQGNAILRTLSGQPVPYQVDHNDWVCIYDLSNNQYLAIAYYMEENPSPVKMLRYFQKL